MIQLWNDSNNVGRWGAAVNVIMAAWNFALGVYFDNWLSYFNVAVAGMVLYLAWLTLRVGAKRKEYHQIENWLVRAAQRRAERQRHD